MERGSAAGINKLIFLKCDDSEFFCLTPLISRVTLLITMVRNSAIVSDIFSSQPYFNNYWLNMFAAGVLSVKPKTALMGRVSSIIPPPPLRRNGASNKLSRNLLYFYSILIDDKRIRQLFCIVLCVFLHRYRFKGKLRFLFHNLAKLFENFDFYAQRIRIGSRILFVKADCAEPFRL